MTDFDRPTPMLLLPTHRVQIIIEASSPAARIVMLNPWPGLPIGWNGDHELHQWQCCATGPLGVITDVVLHLPHESTDPAFTVKVSVDETEVQHLLDNHGFVAA